MERQARWFVALVLGVVLLAACTLLLPDAGEPTATILSPAAGSTVVVNQPVTVQVQGNDPDGPGVFRIDLQVNDVTVNTFEAGGPQASVMTELSFTPTAEGAISVGAIAFREDGTASQPAVIALSVVGATTEAPTVQEGSGESTESEGQSSSSSGSGGGVTGTAGELTNIRAKPGPGCEIVGQVQSGETVTFLERTTWEPHWYRIDRGWVYNEPFSVGDDSAVPRVNEQGCLYCGDGVCSEEVNEVCDECTQDCGVCPYCGDGEVNQDSEECDGDSTVCGAGYVCNATCGCEVAPPTCGDGNVDPGEQCDGGGCGVTETCNQSCMCVPQVIVPAGVCGNGVVEAGEDCDPPGICVIPGQQVCNIACKYSICP